MRTIKSVSRQRILYPECELADTPWKKTKGLMFRTHFRKPILFILNRVGKQAASIHSFFCRVRFDAVFLGENKQVVDIVADIGPNRLVTPKAAAAFLLEMPAGDAKKKGIEEGEQLAF